VSVDAQVEPTSAGQAFDGDDVDGMAALLPRLAFPRRLPLA
jgi:hypothetical protein